MDEECILLCHDNDPMWVFTCCGIRSCFIIGKNKSAIVIDLANIYTDDVDIIVEYLKYLDVHELVHWATNETTEYWNEYLVKVLMEFMSQDKLMKMEEMC